MNDYSNGIHKLETIFSSLLFSIIFLRPIPWSQRQQITFSKKNKKNISRTVIKNWRKKKSYALKFKLYRAMFHFYSFFLILGVFCLLFSRFFPPPLPLNTWIYKARTGSNWPPLKRTLVINNHRVNPKKKIKQEKKTFIDILHRFPLSLYIFKAKSPHFLFCGIHSCVFF